MPVQDVFLLKDNVPFVFDRRSKKLVRLSGNERIEIVDENRVAKIITSNVAVITWEEARKNSIGRH